jgi:hypothetical protein
VLVVLGAFVMSLGACLFVLLPRDAFVFSLNARELYERFYGLDVAEVHRRLTYDLTYFWDSNDVLLAPVRRVFRLAAFALAVEVVGLLLLAGDTI